MKQKNIRLFFAHEALFQMSDAMLTILLPIFIYKLFHSISAVFLFTFAWNLIYGHLFIPIFSLAMKSKRPKYFMALGMVFYSVALALFSQAIPEKSYWVIPATLAFSLYVSFYWMVRHWFFSVNASHQIIGKQISALAILRIAISFLGPVIGGLVSYFISFNAALFLGSVAGALSIIPILLFDAPPHPRGYTWKKVKWILGKKEYKAMRPAYFLEGFYAYMVGFAWILAFYIFIGNIKQLGILEGVSYLVAVILTALAGHWFDRKNRIKLLAKTTNAKLLGSLLMASVFFFPHMAYIWGVNIFNRFAGSMQQTVVDSYLFGYSSKIHPVRFHLNREVHLTIARFLCSGMMAVLFYYLPPTALWPIIGLGSFTALGWLTIGKSDYLLHGIKAKKNGKMV
ncbi:hypothetical protein JXA05_00190 [Candidatus Peregrinibacteria bacterium]|nr:hypothetical protein [Candidatus Peregrinibacteria bacterium]